MTISDESMKLIRHLGEKLGYQGNDRALLDEVDRLRAREKRLVEAAQELVNAAVATEFSGTDEELDRFEAACGAVEKALAES